jgi:hypothetical protein
MRDIFRESAIGQCLRFFRCKHLAPYPEELPDFKLPAEYSSKKSIAVDQMNANVPQISSSIEEGRLDTHTPHQTNTKKTSSS